MTAMKIRFLGGSGRSRARNSTWDADSRVSRRLRPLPGAALSQPQLAAVSRPPGGHRVHPPDPRPSGSLRLYSASFRRQPRPHPGRPPTAELARIILLDSAHIQEEDAAFKKKRHAKEGRKGPHPEIPLYTIGDAEHAILAFEPVAYEKRIVLGRRTSVVFHDAGHILGSSMLQVESGEGAAVRRIVFSGDIGRWDSPLVQDPSVFSRADYVVMESTYGDRDHEDPEPIESLLARIINETAGIGGKVLMPVFAMERAQEVLYYLGKLLRAKRIPPLPVIMDSPMAVEITKVFERYPSYLDEEAKAIVRSGRSLFQFPGLRLTPTMADSKAVNDMEGAGRHSGRIGDGHGRAGSSII